jgi:hypothetical protein
MSLLLATLHHEGGVILMVALFFCHLSGRALLPSPPFLPLLHDKGYLVRIFLVASVTRRLEPPFWTYTYKTNAILHNLWHYKYPPDFINIWCFGKAKLTCQNLLYIGSRGSMCVVTPLGCPHVTRYSPTWDTYVVTCTCNVLAQTLAMQFPKLYKLAFR